MSFLVNIHTPRLLLKSLCEDDAPPHYQVWSDPQATQWSSHGCCKTLDESREFMRGALQLDEACNKRFYGVFEVNDLSNCIGLLSLLPYFREDHHKVKLEAAGGDVATTWEVAYIFRPEYWNKGYATEAVKAAAAKLREGRGGQKTSIIGYVYEANAASNRVMEKSGLSFTGEKLRLGEEKEWRASRWIDPVVLVYSVDFNA